MMQRGNDEIARSGERQRTDGARPRRRRDAAVGEVADRGEERDGVGGIDDRGDARRDEAVVAVEPREPVGRVVVEQVDGRVDRDAARRRAGRRIAA